MKTLYVLRHGQAAPEGRSSADHERPLTVLGRAEARRSAQSLTARELPPSLLLSSSAVRARETVELCLAMLPAGTELRVLPELYLAEPSSYLAALAAGADPHRAVLVVGHNPGLEALIQLLSERSEHLATASLVEIELAVGAWADLSGVARGSGRIVRTFRADARGC